MCGIVGLYLKNPALEKDLGALFAPMLVSMSERGPDSAGFAIYGDEVPVNACKLTLRSDVLGYPWGELATQLENQFNVAVTWFQNHVVAVFKVAASAAAVADFVATHRPDVTLLSAGHSIEILKEVGPPALIAERFGLNRMKGSHIIGHTRMATESAVTMAGSHPFSTGLDLCLVHNGSLSNHNRLRLTLEREGIHFATDNDSEVAAGFLTWRLAQGDSLTQALTQALKDLDGFYTFTIGTRDGFAVLRDPIACKPAVMCETADYVAMASEYRALTNLPGIEQAKVWEPAPAKVYVWERNHA